MVQAFFLRFAISRDAHERAGAGSPAPAAPAAPAAAKPMNSRLFSRMTSSAYFAFAFSAHLAFITFMRGVSPFALRRLAFSSPSCSSDQMTFSRKAW